MASARSPSATDAPYRTRTAPVRESEGQEAVVDVLPIGEEERRPAQGAAHDGEQRVGDGEAERDDGDDDRDGRLRLVVALDRARGEHEAEGTCCSTRSRRTFATSKRKNATAGMSKRAREATGADERWTHCQHPESAAIPRPSTSPASGDEAARKEYAACP
jgi:hypothetical protein